MRPRPAPLALTILLLSPVLAGCIADGGDDTPGTELSRVEVYEYRYSGDDTFAALVPYGFLARIHNPTATTAGVVVTGLGAVDKWGPAVGTEGWLTSAPDNVWALQPGGNRLFLFQATASEGAHQPLGFSVDVVRYDGEGSTTSVLEREEFWRNVTFEPGRAVINPGDHVQTATVGLWTNGTSFYTNIGDLNEDPNFPAGYDRDDFGGAPLPIYVYDETREEQPAGSKDTCHFTTITGYNELLKTQAPGSTNVRFLQPGEAYTVQGAEDHFLYGDALIFMNTIVTHDGPTGPADEAPDPTGACFDPNNTSPVSIPIDVPPALLAL